MDGSTDGQQTDMLQRINRRTDKAPYRVASSRLEGKPGTERINRGQKNEVINEEINRVNVTDKGTGYTMVSLPDFVL